MDSRADPHRPCIQGQELGEVLLPVLSPFSFRHPDDAVRLGRATVWDEPEDGDPVPFGQKMLLVDGEEFPILEVRQSGDHRGQGDLRTTCLSRVIC